MGVYIKARVLPPTYDSNAQAVITAIESTGVTLTTTQKNACNQLIVDLKGFGIWTKMKALYGFLGGTAGAHKWNWKDPRDLDAAFRLVFNGGWTHSATGALPNGTNAWANTFLVPSNALFVSNKNIHLSYYSRTNNSSLGYEYGNSLDGFRNSFGLICGFTNGNAYAFYGAFVQANPVNSLGLFISNSTATNVQIIKNGAILLQGAAATTSLNLFTQTTPLGANRDPNGALNEYSTKQCAFSSIGDGLNATEAANFRTAVQAYNTTLSRQV